MKLLSFRRSEVIYSWHGIIVRGYNWSSNVYYLNFPSPKDTEKLILNGENFSYIVHDYEVVSYNPEYDFKEGAMRMAQREVEKEMQDIDNKRLLMVMIFEDKIKLEGK